MSIIFLLSARNLYIVLLLLFPPDFFFEVEISPSDCFKRSADLCITDSSPGLPVAVMNTDQTAFEPTACCRYFVAIHIASGLTAVAAEQ